MKKMFWLLFFIGVTGVGVYFFNNNIKEDGGYTKEFTKEMAEYVVKMNEWSEKESEIAQEFNKKVVNIDRKETVVAYKFLKSDIIPKQEALIEEVEATDVEERKTKKIKEKYLNVLYGEIIAYKKHYDSFDKQNITLFEEANIKMKEVRKQKDEFEIEMKTVMAKVKAKAEEMK